jgi:hypothetical protein
MVLNCHTRITILNLKNPRGVFKKISYNFFYNRHPSNSSSDAKKKINKYKNKSINKKLLQNTGYQLKSTTNIENNGFTLEFSFSNEL